MAQNTASDSTTISPIDRFAAIQTDCQLSDDSIRRLRAVNTLRGCSYADAVRTVRDLVTPCGETIAVAILCAHLIEEARQIAQRLDHRIALLMNGTDGVLTRTKIREMIERCTVVLLCAPEQFQAGIENSRRLLPDASARADFFIMHPEFFDLPSSFVSEFAANHDPASGALDQGLWSELATFCQDQRQYETLAEQQLSKLCVNAGISIPGAGRILKRLYGNKHPIKDALAFAQILTERGQWTGDELYTMLDSMRSPHTAERAERILAMQTILVGALFLPHKTIQNVISQEPSVLQHSPAEVIAQLQAYAPVEENDPSRARAPLTPLGRLRYIIHRMELSRTEPIPPTPRLAAQRTPKIRPHVVELLRSLQPALQNAEIPEAERPTIINKLIARFGQNTEEAKAYLQSLIDRGWCGLPMIAIFTDSRLWRTKITQVFAIQDALEALGLLPPASTAAIVELPRLLNMAPAELTERIKAVLGPTPPPQIIAPLLKEHQTLLRCGIDELHRRREARERIHGVGAIAASPRRLHFRPNGDRAADASDRTETLEPVPPPPPPPIPSVTGDESVDACIAAGWEQKASEKHLKAFPFLRKLLPHNLHAALCVFAGLGWKNTPFTQHLVNRATAWASLTTALADPALRASTDARTPRLLPSTDRIQAFIAGVHDCNDATLRTTLLQLNSLDMPGRRGAKLLHLHPEYLLHQGRPIVVTGGFVKHFGQHLSWTRNEKTVLISQLVTNETSRAVLFEDPTTFDYAGRINVLRRVDVDDRFTFNAEGLDFTHDWARLYMPLPELQTRLAILLRERCLTENYIPTLFRLTRRDFLKNLEEDRVQQRKRRR